MKLLYVAGPYRAATEHGVAENIRRAEAFAVAIWKLGAAVLCPHKNTAFLGGAVPDRTFLDGDIVMMLRCDAVAVTRNWRDSAGAREEVRVAFEHGIPVLHDISEVEAFLRGGE